MFDHVGLRVRDLAQSTRFFQRALEPLGHGLLSEGSGYAGFGPRGPGGAPALWLHEHAPPAGTVAVGVHLAFVAPSREAVQRFHAAGLEAGARDNGAPGLRRDYGETYYAAFLIDGEGNNVEAVCVEA